MIDLSIIIPHHNDSSRLKRLLDSIPIRDNIEVIIIDDHSESEELKNVKELVKGISWILDNNKDGYLGKKSRKYIMDNFSMDIVANKHIQLCVNMLDEANGI